MPLPKRSDDSLTVPSLTLFTTGYSVLEEKKLLSHDDFTVVTGAPRDGSKGSVMFGTKTDTTINEELIIPGEQVGSYFGSSIAVTDLNNDEYVSINYDKYFNCALSKMNRYSMENNKTGSCLDLTLVGMSLK